MNKRIIYVLIAALIIGGFFIINSQINKSTTTKQVQLKQLVDQKSNDVNFDLQKAKAKAEAEAAEAAALKVEAKKLKDIAAAEMKAAQEKAAAEMKAVEEQAKIQAANLKAQMQELIAKAKEYLQNADYENAIKTAKEVLAKFDANSEEAKGIIAAAQEKLKAMAQEKLGDVTDSLGSFGQ